MRSEEEIRRHIADLERCAGPCGHRHIEPLEKFMCEAGGAQMLASARVLRWALGEMPQNPAGGSYQVVIDRLHAHQPPHEVN